MKTKSSKECEKIWKIIQKINKEVGENINNLKHDHAEYNNDDLLRRKKEKILELKERLKFLRDQNEKILQTQREKNDYSQKQNKLSALVSRFQYENNLYSADIKENASELPSDTEDEILAKIEEIIRQLNSEIDDNSENFEQEIENLNRINAALDREIDLLKLLKPDKVKYIDNFDLAFEEYCDKFSPEADNFKSLKDVNFDSINDEENIKIEASEAEIPIQSQLSITEMENNIVDVIKGCKQKNNFIKHNYLLQHQELSKIIDALNDRPINLCDQIEIENFLQKRLQLMRSKEKIPLIQIPSKLNENVSKVEMINEVFRKFDSLFNEINQMQEAQKKSQIPDFTIPDLQIPPSPKFLRSSRPSEDLVKFADSLRSIIDLTNKVIPAELSQSINQNYKVLLNLERSEADFPSIDSPADVFGPSDEEITDDTNFDTSHIDRLKTALKEKLPESLLPNLDAERSSVTFPAFNSSSSKIAEDEFSEASENSDGNTNFLNRIKTTNAILREIVNKDKMEIPQIKMPERSKKTPPSIDNESFIESVRNALSPEQQSIRCMKGEIRWLKAKIEDVAALDSEREEEETAEDDENKKTVEDENARLERDIQESEQEYDQMETRISEMTEVRNKLKDEIQAFRDEIEANAVTEKMIEELNNEYKKRKEDLQNRKEHYELLKMLRAQS